MSDELPIAIAVTCEQWTNGADVLDTFVTLTTPPNALIARITDRMPAILPRETWATCLGETGATLDDVKALLQPFEDGNNWTMTPQVPSRPSRPAKPLRQKSQGELFWIGTMGVPIAQVR